jgi:hypothetical protein
MFGTHITQTIWTSASVKRHNKLIRAAKPELRNCKQQNVKFLSRVLCMPHCRQTRNFQNTYPPLPWRGTVNDSTTPLCYWFQCRFFFWFCHYWLWHLAKPPLLFDHPMCFLAFSHFANSAYKDGSGRIHPTQNRSRTPLSTGLLGCRIRQLFSPLISAVSKTCFLARNHDYEEKLY